MELPVPLVPTVQNCKCASPKYIGEDISPLVCLSSCPPGHWSLLYVCCTYSSSLVILCTYCTQYLDWARHVLYICTLYPVALFSAMLPGPNGPVLTPPIGGYFTPSTKNKIVLPVWTHSPHQPRIPGLFITRPAMWIVFTQPNRVGLSLGVEIPSVRLFCSSITASPSPPSCLNSGSYDQNEENRPLPNFLSKFQK